MDTYLENHIHSEYQGSKLNGFLNFFVVHNKGLVKESLKSDMPKPLRGLGRYRPNIKVVENSIIDTVRLQEPGTFRGYGRKRTFYTDLAKSLLQNKPETSNTVKKTYNYWRGAGKPRPKNTNTSF